MAYNILIVDDSISMRKVMAKVIRMSGFPVNDILEAENGIEGISQVEQCSVDFILTDLNMPGMDGISFIRELHRREEFESIPVVVVSTEGRSEVIDEVETLGIIDYVQKPFQPEVISDTLRSLLESEDDIAEFADPEAPDF